MKKIGFVFIFAILLVALLIFVSAASIDEDFNRAISDAAGVDVSEQVKGFVGEFVQKRGIQPENVKGVSQVDFKNLPKEVNIQGINDNNLAIYQVDYENPSTQESEKVFVIGYSVEELRAQGDLIIAQDKRNFLNFGSTGSVNNSTFLGTATGVKTDSKKGYVMVRDGSITGLSTNLDVVKGNPGKVEIIVLKNGKPISFGNTLDTSSTGSKKDYDVQSKGIVEFQAGDVISAYAQSSKGVSYRDAIVLIEITTTN